MKDLKTQQQKLVSDIYNLQSDKANLGIKIHQNNLLASAMRSLDISHPHTKRLLGDEIWPSLAKRLLQHSPLQTPTWNEFGASFSQVISKLADLDDYPYLEDCARYEWSLFLSEQSSSESFDQSSALLLQELDLDNVYIRFQNSFLLFSSRYPIEDIYLAQDYGSHNADQHFLNAQQQLGNNVYQEYLMIFRERFKSRSIKTEPGDYWFLRHCMSGMSIGAAIDAISSGAKPTAPQISDSQLSDSPPRAILSETSVNNFTIDLGQILAKLINMQAISELYSKTNHVAK